MIYWQWINDFRSACKMITYLRYEEFEHILHTPEEELRAEFDGITAQQAISFKRALRHYTHLRKLDTATKAPEHQNHHISAKHAPKLEHIKIGNFTEIYWWNRDQTERKKVCGYPLKGYAKGFVCIKTPGHGTIHKGYGYCMEHEALMTRTEKQELWVGLRASFGNVPTFQDILDKSEKLANTTMKDMDSDLHYLELARTLLIRAIAQSEAQGAVGGVGSLDTTFDRNRRNDLATLSDISSKIKERKKKVEQMNYIPPEQVGVIILQVLESVTKGESPEVRARVAARAQELSNILIPRIEENPSEPKLPKTYAQEAVDDAVFRAKQVIRENGGLAEGSWAEDESAGVVQKTIVNEKKPNYRHGYKKDRTIPPPPAKLNLTLKK